MVGLITCREHFRLGFIGPTFFLSRCDLVLSQCEDVISSLLEDPIKIKQLSCHVKYEKFICAASFCSLTLFDICSCIHLLGGYSRHSFPNYIFLSPF